MTVDYLIAVDAGGTKTRALAYRADDYTPIPPSETVAVDNMEADVEKLGDLYWEKEKYGES